MNIDKAIPIPPKQGIYPWLEMEVGDSIFVKKTRREIQGSISYFKLRYGMLFKIRKWEENGIIGVRVWLLKKQDAE